jgi:hypothetical protein
MLQKSCGVWKRYFVGKIHHFSPSFSSFSTRCPLLMFSRKLWWLEIWWGRTINRKTIITVHGTLCTILPHNQYAGHRPKWSVKRSLCHKLQLKRRYRTYAYTMYPQNSFSVYSLIFFVVITVSFVRKNAKTHATLGVIFTNTSTN